MIAPHKNISTDDNLQKGEIRALRESLFFLLALPGVG